MRKDKMKSQMNVLLVVLFFYEFGKFIYSKINKHYFYYTIFRGNLVKYTFTQGDYAFAAFLFLFGIEFKGTTRGLSGVFLPLVMNPSCPLLWEESVRWFHNSAGPLDVPLMTYTYIDYAPLFILEYLDMSC